MRKITEGSADEIFNALGHCYNGVCGGCPYAPQKGLSRSSSARRI